MKRWVIREIRITGMHIRPLCQQTGNWNHDVVYSRVVVGKIGKVVAESLKKAYREAFLQYGRRLYGMACYDIVPEGTSNTEFLDDFPG